MQPTYVEKLATFIASRTADALGRAVIDKLHACLLFNLSVALAAPPADNVRRALEHTHAAPGDARCWRTGAALSPADAAFRNAALITARGQNDTHAAMNGHIGCVAIPAVIALAEETGACAGDVCAALACAYDVAPLVARSAAMKSGERGFRGTSLYAVFSAAAGAARVLRLDAVQCAAALSIASQFSGGTMQCWAEGTPEWLLQVGMASRAGVVAARLAQYGMGGAAHALEGPNGFYRAFAGEVPQWQWNGEAPDEILAVTFKPFPGCTINQLPVKTLIDGKRRDGFTASDVERMTLALHPAYARYPGVDRHGPFDSASSAIMSAAFMLQTVLENDTLTLADFTPGHAPAALHDRSRRIEVVADTSLAPFHCRIDVVLRDGRVVRLDSGAPSALAYTLDEVKSLTRRMSTEWRVAERDVAYDRLSRQLAQLCTPGASERRFDEVFDLAPVIGISQRRAKMAGV
ncbi:MmgE/PrpD family protein [Pandoraea pnomenusa]|uniref:MmgE/PrpD family protein n=1 Tax=Pandoraea TaxID=93217 RepID=UPI00068F64C1|nr:MmgE/PrpD family protein [Pandoraea sp. E26]